MDFNVILHRILDVAKYPSGKREDFVRDFYDYYFTKLIEQIGGVDPTLAQKLMYVFDHYSENTQGLSDLWKQMEADPQSKEVMDKVTNEVISELVDDLLKNASEAEKQEILTLVGV